MKKKNFFMLALAAVAFAACSNEDLVPTGNPGDDNQLVTRIKNHYSACHILYGKCE